ncbi:Antirepressor [Streptococcus equi subsp. equi]|uniref:phage antirepressor n=1 Tax=Streptococcus equi TaxID=1336 RepID=UPI000658437B|nr:phage antirepressor [Streptococcus equi]CRS95771.1 Antirepressor [Streptococcus equi subsp. equi]CRT14504.1 Antirepressor [Streptococcus equi subsp. equi]CRT18533.1 Antirepressor [Streptococcus equi subsp. equi]HEK9686047.1 phage antirepressor [Streptococcus equi subsp. equi]
MNEIFNFKGQEVRTVTINNEPYFSNSDVCRILEINNPSQALKRLKADGVISNEVIDSLGRKQKMKFVSESNLYKLIFQSKKQEAEAFTDWVTSEVLPAIRKHGAYVTDYKAVDLLTNPNALGNFLQGLTEQVKRLETKIEKDKPKVLFANAVEASETSILIGDFAKILRQNGYNIGQNRLFAWLRENGFLIRKNGESYNMPTQRSMDMKLFEVKERTHQEPNGSIRISKTTKLTGKGQQYFINKFLDQEYLPN